MKKNPLLVILGISGFIFVIFMIFVFMVLQTIVKDGDSPLAGLGKGGKIGVVPVEGVIMEETAKKFRKQMKKFMEDSRIKGIIVRINSPGGAVAPSQELHDLILEYKEEKPIIASFATVAASGGYYTAVAADKIITNAGTLTGSIGVIMQFADLSKLYDWAKMRPYNVKSGKFKDVGSDFRQMSPEERAMLQEMIDGVHMQFVRAVAKGRKIGLERAKELATGQIYTGEQAVNHKLADRLGGLSVAIEEIKGMANISEDEDVELVYPRKKRKSIFDAMEPFGSAIGRSIVEGLGFQVKSPSAKDWLQTKSPSYLFLAPGLGQ